jgi:hypothetical protein
MDRNPYLMEKWSEAYQQQRLIEAEESRLLHEICSNVRPFWRQLALVLAAVLIALGQSLQKAAEPRSQFVRENC